MFQINPTKNPEIGTENLYFPDLDRGAQTCPFRIINHPD